MPRSSQTQADYEGPLIAYMGNMFAIRTINGSPSSKGPSLKFGHIRQPTTARLILDMGMSAHSVWTETSAPGNASAAYGMAWPVPVHYLRSALKEGQDWQQGGGAGVHAVHADNHVEFYGGQRFESGPGKLDAPAFLWWREGI
jgi:hypothetical protein